MMRDGDRIYEADYLASAFNGVSGAYFRFETDKKADDFVARVADGTAIIKVLDGNKILLRRGGKQLWRGKHSSNPERQYNIVVVVSLELTSDPAGMNVLNTYPESPTRINPMSGTTS